MNLNELLFDQIVFSAFLFLAGCVVGFVTAMWVESHWL
jgi:ABC-type multidrug transport system permease subunit